VLALAEIRQGIELCEPGKRRAALEEWLEQDLRRSFETRLLPVTQVPFVAARRHEQDRSARP
jgi:hypothetical protein